MFSIAKMNEVVEAYKSGLTLHQTAKKVDLSVSTVLSILATNNVKRRPKGRVPGVPNTANAERNREMVRLYDKEKLTLEEIGARYELTRERVRQIINKTRGKLSKRRHNRSQRVLMLQGAQRKQLQELADEGLTASEAAARLGTCCSSVHVQAKRYGITFKDTFHEAREKDAKAAQLYQLGVRAAEIARVVGDAHQTAIFRRLKRAGVTPARLSARAA